MDKKTQRTRCVTSRCLNNADQLPRLKSHAAADRSAAFQKPCQHPLQVIRSPTGHVQASTLRNQLEKPKFPQGQSACSPSAKVEENNLGLEKQSGSPQTLLSETRHQSVTSMKVGKPSCIRLTSCERLRTMQFLDPWLDRRRCGHGCVSEPDERWLHTSNTNHDAPAQIITGRQTWHSRSPTEPTWVSWDKLWASPQFPGKSRLHADRQRVPGQAA